MKFILRIFSILSVIILGIYIIFLSFLSSKNQIELPASANNIYTQSLNQFDTMSGSIKVDTPLPGVIFQSSGDIKITNTWSEDISISWFEKTKSFISVYNTLKNFSLSGSLFWGKLISPGDIFIDATKDTGNIFLYSLSATLHITLKGKNGETYTELTLFPHMYIQFNPEKAFLLKGADMLRVNNFYRLGYFDGKVRELYEKSLLEESLGKDSFYETSVSNISKLKNASAQFFSQYKNIKLYDFPGKEILEKYHTVFINSAKEKELVKNAYFSHIIRTLKWEYTLTDATLRDQSYKTKLETLSKKDSRELQNFKETILYNLFPHTGIQSVRAKQLFASLVSHNTSHNTKNYPYFAYSIFSENSEGIIWEDTDIYNQYGAYIESLNLRAEQKKIYYQYFSFFIEQQIYDILASNTAKRLPFISRLLSHHIALWNVSYNQDNTSIKTGVYVYGEMLEVLEKFMRENFFHISRNSAWLLQIKKTDINSSQISSFEKQIQTIYALFQKNKGYLNSQDIRDVAIDEKFVTAYKKMEEYLLALQNYQSYENEYDILKKNILTIDTINDSKNTNWTETDIRNYFSQFEGVNISQSKIEQQKSIFLVSDYIVLNNTLSFSVDPRDEYKIYNLTINGEKKSFQYKLEIIKKNSEKNAQYEDPNVEEVWNSFEKFFVNLVSQKTKTIEIYSWEETKKLEDAAEIVFKKIKLLGKSGEFSSIKDILPIKYDDILLTRQSSGYDISIRNTPMNIEREKYIFSSQYVFSETEHYFTNIELKSQEKKFSTSITWIVEIQNIWWALQKLWANLSKFQETNTILGNKVFTPIDISYNPISEKMTFKFVSWKEKYTIIQSWDEIEKIFKGIKNILPQSISPSQIPSYL